MVVREPPVRKCRASAFSASWRKVSGVQVARVPYCILSYEGTDAIILQTSFGWPTNSVFRHHELSWIEMRRTILRIESRRIMGPIDRSCHNCMRETRMVSISYHVLFHMIISTTRYSQS